MTFRRSGVERVTLGRSSPIHASWSRSHSANWAWPVAVKCTPSLNQRSLAAPMLAAFQSSTTSCGQRALAASSAWFDGANVGVPDDRRRSDMLTHSTRLAPLATRAAISWSISRAMSAGQSL